VTTLLAAAQLPHPPVTFMPVAPELVLVGTAIAVMLLDAFYPGLPRIWFATLSLAGIVVAAGFAVSLWSWTGPPVVLGAMVSVDRFTVFFQLLLLGVAAVAIFLAYLYLERSGEDRGEYYALLLFATAGMTLITAASDLILVFLALEILSLPLYLLTGFSFRRLASAEASMKYFLLGAFSSAFFLFGVAFAYGATGTTNLAGISRALARAQLYLAQAHRGGLFATPVPGFTGPGPHPSIELALIAAGLLAVGLLFKVAAVPFHMWTPDAYQGAPTCVTAFMSAGTKVAAFAAFLRVFTVAFHPLTADWRPFVAAIAILSMVVGSVLALAQSDVKRMLAYSSIAQAGFILVGVSAASPAGVQASMFYLLAYSAMILGAFGVVILVSVRGERHTSLGAYRGLARRSPFLAAVLSLFLLSLAGIPPTGGFMAKVTSFEAAVRSGYWPVVLVAVLASVVAAFFYLRVIVLMYMQDPEQDEALSVTPVPRVAISVLAAITLAVGVFPGLVFGALQTASTVRF
jgi:NADH-quinone oxidoreductase subunit N